MESYEIILLLLFDFFLKKKKEYTHALIPGKIRRQTFLKKK